MISTEKDIQTSCRNIEEQGISRLLVLLPVVIIMIAFAWSNNLYAEEPDNTQAWEAFVPPPDEYDWIQLKSGEWLKGNIKVLYDRTLQFDSDELDLLKFDMEDVKRIRGHGIKGVRLESKNTVPVFIGGRWQMPEPITVYGTLEVTEDKVIVFFQDTRR